MSLFGRCSFVGLSFLLGLLCWAVAPAKADDHPNRKTKVLVLHSYHQGLEWTDNISQGIASVFRPHQQRYELYYEYLDTKRNPGREYIDRAAQVVKEKNSDAEYGAIIVADNNALALVNRQRDMFAGDPILVFCGINNFNSELVSGIERYIGVAEKTDHRGTIDLMRKVHPERNKILVIVDQTPTGKAIRAELNQSLEEFPVDAEFEFYSDFLLDDVVGKTSALTDKHLIYITAFNRDRNNNFISYSEGIQMISRDTKVPMYGSWDFYLGKGIVGGKITSGVLQGQTAARLAFEWMEGTGRDNNKVVFDSPTQYMFDHVYLKKNGIKSSLLPSDSVIINAPPGFFERYKWFIVVIAVVSIGAALYSAWRDRRRKMALYEKQKLAEELEQKVQQRTEALKVANEKLHHLSYVDGLTQLYNRRHFDEQLLKEIRRAQRADTPISLLLCDIDFFKDYNDLYGHVLGDDCLSKVAHVIKSQCQRSSDLTARYGGEEFAIILPNSTVDEAKDIADAICSELHRLKLPHAASKATDHVTLSIGIVSMIPDANTTPSCFVKHADKALYHSKKMGRNRITINRFDKLVECI